ncbi:hypothetical protein NA57DRAFT_33398 [Rhizodiscina lignyota]|uniref:Dynamin-type G domain-containing protein n=1 Tax=Rhizodiscina lignyota TaxID=1504668 RepID=A0A9P4MA20_9PEZI|nr:hypothetical protein NA57DRAFT_33398 [Rhizodiscina lignyota]
MSQEEASSSAGGSSRVPPDEQPQNGGYRRPNYMTVGTGGTSESARRLQSILDDSGYGGSITDGDGSVASGFHPGMTGDRYTPIHTPGEPNAIGDNDRKILASHVHQLYYNQNKTALGRAITRTVETLKKLQEMNKQWPAHYPSVQRAPEQAPAERRFSRPNLQHTQSTLEPTQEPQQASPSRPSAPRRAETSIGDDGTHGESSSTAEKRSVPEPRLVSPQLAQDFSILKLDLKLGAASQTDLVHSLEKQSIAALLDGQIVKTIRHLYSLRERIEDTSSKVLVTGDLNAGKSTFCNALLRRKVLPEDQQPCTSIFCEVLDSRENGGIEEVHAVPINMIYDRNNESTYHVYALKQLEQIVTDNEKYSQCKVYVKDIRAVDESLLNNGVVDIALIDAPGLNADSLKTTAVFARQEEIDVVVFVVSAANHFTQSAREFVFNAAMEKAYIFMVVNGFDNIRDKRRCQEMILKQVHQLSPATFKESSELVHFVSSNAIPVAPAELPGPPDGSEPGSPGEKGKGKEKEKLRDFAELEASLRRFVLEKRARSKLAPAKTYLMNVLGDLQSLATVNRDVAQSELDRVTKELQDLVPQLDQSKKATSEAGEDANKEVEDGAQEIYDQTRKTLDEVIGNVGVRDLGIQYPGLLSAYEYADDIKAAMLQEIVDTVSSCEEHARQRTIQGVNTIKNLGLLHLGNGFAEFTFRADQMFMRRKDLLAKQVDFDVELADFFDFANLWERQEKIAGTSMALTVAGVVGGRLMGGTHWIDSALAVGKVMGTQNLRRMVIPGIVLTVVLAASYALASIPQSLPRRLSAKLSSELNRLDYTHENSARIAKEVRRALRYPAGDLRVGLQRNFEKLQGKKEETDKLRYESDVARKYFSNLVRESGEVKSGVERVDLEGPAPGVAAGYDF